MIYSVVSFRYTTKLVMYSFFFIYICIYICIHSFSYIYIYVFILFQIFPHIDYYRILIGFPVLYSRSLWVIYFIYISVHRLGFLGGSAVKNLPASAEDSRDICLVFAWGDPLEKEMSTHSRILSWKVPWTEESGRLESLGSKRVGHD